MSSELSRIISQPFDGKSKQKKKELALFAFMRSQQSNQPAPATISSAGPVPKRQTAQRQ